MPIEVRKELIGPKEGWKITIQTAAIAIELEM